MIRATTKRPARLTSRLTVLMAVAACLAAVGPDGPATVAPPGADEPAGRGVVLPFPGREWALVVDLPGFELSAPRDAADRSRRVVLGENESTGMEVSVVLEAVPGAGTAADCRKHFGRLTRRRSQARRSLVKERRTPEAVVVGYTLEGLQDGAFHQRHVNAYLGRDSLCVDLHLSKERSNWMDAELFDAIVRSTRLEPPPGAAVSSPGAPPPTAAPRARGAPAASRPVSSVRSFPVPGRTWSVFLETFGLVMDASAPVYEFEPEGRGFKGQRVLGWWWIGKRVASGLSLVVAVEESAHSRTAATCRDAIWPRIRLGMPLRIEEVRTGENDRAAWVGYLKPWRQRALIDARTLHVFLVHEGVCVTASLERTDPWPGDEALIDAFLQAARVRADPGAGPAGTTATPP